MALARVYVGDVLYNFINDNRAKFGSINGPAAGPNLIDNLIWGQNGYFYRFALTALIGIYALKNNLKDPHDPTYLIPDAYMHEYFGGNRAATFYLYRNQNNEVQRMLMGDAVNAGLIERPLNTFEVIQRVRPDFNPARFQFYYLQNVAAVNYLTLPYLEQHLNFPGYQEIYTNLTSANVLELLRQEQNGIVNAHALWL